MRPTARIACAVGLAFAMAFPSGDIHAQEASGDALVAEQVFACLDPTLEGQEQLQATGRCMDEVWRACPEVSGDAEASVCTARLERFALREADRIQEGLVAETRDMEMAVRERLAVILQQIEQRVEDGCTGPRPCGYGPEGFRLAEMRAVASFVNKDLLTP